MTGQNAKVNPMLAPAAINESGNANSSTVTARLDAPAHEQVATMNSDYVIERQLLTLKAGETSTSTRITAIQDAIDEIDEMVMIRTSHRTAPPNGTGIIYLTST